jgi:hypothetical protein
VHSVQTILNQTKANAIFDVTVAYVDQLVCGCGFDAMTFHQLGYVE